MTKRNIDLLSNRDMFVKYANVVEVARNAKIKIWHTGRVNCVEYKDKHNGKKNFVIRSATPNVKGIEKFVGIIHELSHVLFESPFISSKKLLKDNWGLRDEIYRLMFNAFNVLEDQRIESQMGKMYLKHKGRFDKTTKKLGILMDTNYSSHMQQDNPVNMLLTIRFQRGNDIKKLKNYKIYEKALKDVVFTDKYGALRILVSLKPYIDEWYRDKCCNEMSCGIDESKAMKLDSKVTDHIFDRNNREQGGEIEEEVDIPNELIGGEEKSKKEIDEIVNMSKELGANVVSDIFDKLRDDGKSLNLPKNLNIVKRLPEKVVIDYKISKGLSKVFKTLRMKKADFIDYYGDEIDVESYVENLIRGNNMGECRINNKNIRGISIVISIDGSSSMEGQSMKNARKMVATMFESVKNLDNVDIKANVWSGKGDGKVGVTEINKTSDLNNIGVNVVGGGYYTTPIHMGIEHSARMIKEMKGSKKMIIVITDGVPNHFNAGYHISMDSYMKSCKKSMIKARHVTPNIMCIVIGDRFSYKRNPVKQLFKPSKIMNFETMTQGSERIIKTFKQMVMKSLV